MVSAVDIQNTEEWLEERKRYIGGSDAPIIMGDSPWKTPYKLWMDKLGLSPPQKKNAAMQRGHDLEPLSRKWFIQQTGIVMTEEVVYHEEHAFMRASLDGRSIFGDQIMEIKNPGQVDHEKALNKEVPDKYYAQLQHAMACNGPHTSFCWYVSRYGSDGVYFQVDRDSTYIEKLIKREREFWDLVETKTPPPLTDKDHEVVFNPELDRLTQRYKDLSILCKELDEVKKEIKRISNGKNIIGSGIKVSYFQTRGPVDYSNIPELNGVDLEKYRKEPVIKSRISLT